MRRPPVNLFEFEELARSRLTKAVYDHIAGGATDEITLRRTRLAFDSIMLRPRMLVDISKCDLSTTVLGETVAFPLMLAPAGDHGKAHPDGEIASVRAAGKLGVPMVVSAGATYTLEQIAKASTGPKWFQQYLYNDSGLTLEMASRAETAGYTALCITLDSSVKAKRERNLRNAYAARPGPNYAAAGLNHAAAGPNHTDGKGAAPAESRDKSCDLKATWAQLDWLASRTRLPLIPKGVLTAEDAKLCVEHGARGLIASNHGARQMDSTFATVEVLPEIVAAVRSMAEVYMDGGIMRGSDILKALACGARAVLIGRPVFWGLAVDGERGVAAVLQTLRDEMETAMAMCGRPNIKSIDASLISTVSPLAAAFPNAGVRA